MRSFNEIFEIAAQRKGGTDALNALLEPPLSPKVLAAIPDDRWLSRFTQCIFNAGFVWKIVEAKWDGFEAAFHGFDVGRCAFMHDEWFDELIQDTRIIRHGAKIQAVRDNAVMLQELAAEHGSAGTVFAQWPATDFAGLLAMLKQRGTRLGGFTGPYAMRFMGVDGFVLSRDVVARLSAEGVIDKNPTSKAAMTKVQAAFNQWMDESDRSLTEISRTLAMSIG